MSSGSSGTKRTAMEREADEEEAGLEPDCADGTAPDPDAADASLTKRARALRVSLSTGEIVTVETGADVTSLAELLRGMLAPPSPLPESEPIVLDLPGDVVRAITRFACQGPNAYATFCAMAGTCHSFRNALASEGLTNRSRGLSIGNRALVETSLDIEESLHHVTEKRDLLPKMCNARGFVGLGAAALAIEFLENMHSSYARLSEQVAASLRRLRSNVVRETRRYYALRHNNDRNSEIYVGLIVRETMEALWKLLKRVDRVVMGPLSAPFQEVVHEIGSYAVICDPNVYGWAAPTASGTYVSHSSVSQNFTLFHAVDDALTKRWRNFEVLLLMSDTSRPWRLPHICDAVPEDCYKIVHECDDEHEQLKRWRIKALNNAPKVAGDGSEPLFMSTQVPTSVARAIYIVNFTATPDMFEVWPKVHTYLGDSPALHMNACFSRLVEMQASNSSALDYRPPISARLTGQLAHHLLSMEKFHQGAVPSPTSVAQRMIVAAIAMTHTSMYDTTRLMAGNEKAYDLWTALLDLQMRGKDCLPGELKSDPGPVTINRFLTRFYADLEPGMSVNMRQGEGIFVGLVRNIKMVTPYTNPWRAVCILDNKSEPTVHRLSGDNAPKELRTSTTGVLVDDIGELLGKLLEEYFAFEKSRYNDALAFPEDVNPATDEGRYLAHQLQIGAVACPPDRAVFTDADILNKLGDDLVAPEYSQVYDKNSFREWFSSLCENRELGLQTRYKTTWLPAVLWMYGKWVSNAPSTFVDGGFMTRTFPLAYLDLVNTYILSSVRRGWDELGDVGRYALEQFDKIEEHVHATDKTYNHKAACAVVQVAKHPDHKLQDVEAVYNRVSVWGRPSGGSTLVEAVYDPVSVWGRPRGEATLLVTVKALCDGDDDVDVPLYDVDIDKRVALFESGTSMDTPDDLSLQEMLVAQLDLCNEIMHEVLVYLPDSSPMIRWFADKTTDVAIACLEHVEFIPSFEHVWFDFDMQIGQRLFCDPLWYMLHTPYSVFSHAPWMMEGQTTAPGTNNSDKSTLAFRRFCGMLTRINLTLLALEQAGAPTDDLVAAIEKRVKKDFAACAQRYTAEGGFRKPDLRDMSAPMPRALFPAVVRSVSNAVSMLDLAPTALFPAVVRSVANAVSMLGLAPTTSAHFACIADELEVWHKEVGDDFYTSNYTGTTHFSSLMCGAREVAHAHLSTGKFEVPRTGRTDISEVKHALLEFFASPQHTLALNLTAIYGSTHTYRGNVVISRITECDLGDNILRIEDDSEPTATRAKAYKLAPPIEGLQDCIRKARIASSPQVKAEAAAAAAAAASRPSFVFGDT